VIEKAKVYQTYLTALEVKKLLRGDADLATGDTLSTVIGASNVTQDGYMSNTVTIDTSQMRTTSNLGNNSTYPAATIDFSGLGTQYELTDLLGTGFNSTCKTCNNHYSVLFVYGGTEKVSSEGYGYTKSGDGQSNYTLQIDLKSMMDKGITDAADFTNALIDVLDDSNFDFHYTQYAAEGGTLYICDDRTQSTPAKNATFDTNPYQIGEGTIKMTMVEDSTSRSFDLQYTYKIDSASTAIVTMKSNAAGNYVLNDNGVGYREFDANNSADLLAARYSIEITNSTADWAQYYDDVMGQIASESQVQLNSTDYDYVDYRADENDNSATVSNFDFKIEESKGLWIQAGANSQQGFLMNWDGFNTYTLGISKTKVTDGFEACSSLLDKIDNAITTISNTRSILGSYENRMEYAYKYDKNTEENVQDAESRIRDTDMAEEMTRLSKQTILEQAGISILTQANQVSQQILKLLG
jgi:flagellin-like hook-associated protein FlgL